MDDEIQRKDNDPIWSETKLVAYMVGVIAVGAAGAYLLNYGFQTHGITQDWFDFAAGAFLVLLGVSEISGGQDLTR